MTTDEQLGLLGAKYDALRFRTERLEQGFMTLLEDVASNPTFAVERARLTMAVHDEAQAASG